MPPSCCSSDLPVVLAGDYNVMPTDLDVYKPERWVDDALFRPEVRTAFQQLLAQGWTDAIHLGEKSYRSGLLSECLRSRCRPPDRSRALMGPPERNRTVMTAASSKPLSESGGSGSRPPGTVQQLPRLSSQEEHP